jgi:hypothetical protein
MQSGHGRLADDGPFIIAVLVVLAASALYGIGLVAQAPEPQPVEPQSVFTLFGAVLGYAFGSRNRREDVQVAKEQREEVQNG